MLTDMIRFEWRYHTRQLSFAAAAALFFAFGFALTARRFGPANVNVDSPYSVAQSIGVLSLFSLFILAVFCANAVVRDRETRMEEIVFTTAVDKLPFLLARFTGSFLAAFTAFSASALGLYAARFLPFHDADRLGSASPLPHLWAVLVIALPNLLFAAVVLFALSTITRGVAASYAGSVLIWVLYFVGAALSNSPLMASSKPAAGGGSSLAALLDPFALTAFFEQTQHWPPAMRNTRLVALTGDFLLNRLLWIGVSAAILAIVYRVFSFRVSSTPRNAAVAEPDAVAPTNTYAPVAVSASRWSAFLSATKLELRAFLLSRPFIAVTLLWAALAAFEMVSDITSGEYGSAVYPAAGILFATFQQPLTIVATVLIVYMSTELVWRERALRVAGILHATAAENGVFAAAKCTALAAQALVLTLTAIVVAMLVQLANGWPIDAAVFASFAYVAAAPLVLFAVAAVAIQSLSRHKYVGMLVVLVVGISGVAGAAAGLHPLVRFGGVTLLPWSEMNGFGRIAGFHWLTLYWSAAAGLVLLFAIAAWRGRRERVARVPALLFAAIAIAAGAFIFSKTRPFDVLASRAAYEKQYKPLATLPQPRVTRVKASIDLGTDRHRIRGHYTLANETNQPIDRVLVALRRGVNGISVMLSDPHRVRYDGRFNTYLFTLERPLPPGARTGLEFFIETRRDRFAFDPAFADNGAYVASSRTFPQLGYRTGYELDDPRERRRRGLPPSKPRPESEIPNAEWVGLDLSVKTAPDQIAVAPGTLVAQSPGFFHFRTDAPVPNQFAVSSARYAVTKETHRGVSIEIYRHPAHTFNVARMMRAASESLAYYTASFGPYPHRHLRLAEVAIPNFSAFAQPGLIFLGEKRAFLVDARDPRRLDLVYRRVAHELAHQWWGYTVVPADLPGATMLTESLTKYAELMVLGRAHGAEEVRQSLAYELDLYLSGRTTAAGAEPPLTRTGDEPWLYYRKGALVMNGLRDLLGEDALNGALRSFLHAQGGPDRKPSAAQLVEHLHAAAPRHRALIDQWMNDVVLYDFRLHSATSRRRADGRYDVTLRITAAKTRGDDRPLPLQEDIAIGLFAGDETLHLAKHPLRHGTQELTITTGRPARFASVDPYLTRIDRAPSDNGASVD